MTTPRLLAIAQRIAAGAPLDEAERDLAVAALRAAADGRPAAALAAGEGRRRRDELLLVLRERHFPGFETAAAKAISAALRKYETGAWRVDREQPNPPYRAGTLRRLLFETLAASGAAPSWVTVYRIFTDTRAVKTERG